MHTHPELAGVAENSQPGEASYPPEKGFSMLFSYSSPFKEQDLLGQLSQQARHK